MAEQRVEIDQQQPDQQDATPNALQQMASVVEEIRQNRARLRGLLQRGMPTQVVARELEETALSFVEDVASGSVALWSFFFNEVLPDIDERLADLEEGGGISFSEEEIEKFERAVATALVHCTKLLEWNKLVPSGDRLDHDGIASLEAQKTLCEELLARMAEVGDEEEEDETKDDTDQEAEAGS
jgi:hypothetical protein